MLELIESNRTRHAALGRTERSRAIAHDAGGYRLFADGELGAAHVAAHAAYDAGELERGHRELGAWLAAHAGRGSEWIHLHFHMALLELARGDWHGAYRRFQRELLPAAATTTDALTDAPALLWRLALAAPYPVALPWNVLRRTALRDLDRCEDRFVELHHLLALVGAGDLVSLERWLESRSARDTSPSAALVCETALALRALLRGRFGETADRLSAAVADLALVGGSRAQRDLFGDIRAWCIDRSNALRGPQLAA